MSLAEFMDHATGLLSDPDELCAFATDYAALCARGEPGFGSERSPEDWSAALTSWRVLQGRQV